MENRCRLCAEFGADQLNALEDLNLILRIFQLFNVKISPEDKLPTTVCHLCSETVKQTWDFSQHVQKSQEILNDILNTEITQEVKLTYGSSTEEVKPRLAEICHTIKKEDLIQKPPTNKVCKKKNQKCYNHFNNGHVDQKKQSQKGERLGAKRRRAERRRQRHPQS
jgi:hypothetical protein